jgi:hypothetical protein
LPITSRGLQQLQILSPPIPNIKLLFEFSEKIR